MLRRPPLPRRRLSRRRNRARRKLGPRNRPRPARTDSAPFAIHGTRARMPAFFFSHMLDEIRKAAAEFDATLHRATSLHALDELRVRYFGRKGGLIPTLFTRLKDVAKEQKKDVGDALNKLRDRLEAELKETSDRVAAQEAGRPAAPTQARATPHSAPPPPRHS